MTAARNRRMKTCGAIRTTFALCRCWPGQPGREDAWRCHARGATTWRMVTIILHWVMVKTESSRVSWPDGGEKSSCCRCSRLPIPTSRSRMTTRGNSRRKHATSWFNWFSRLTIRVIPANLRAIEWHGAFLFCEWSDVIRNRESLESIYDSKINTSIKWYHDWLH